MGVRPSERFQTAFQAGYNALATCWKRLNSHAFMMQQPAFDGQRVVFAAGKTAEAAFGYHAVAGHHQRERVFAAGTAHGARAAADLAGDVLITHHLSGGDLANCLPYFLLKRRAFG